MADLMLTEAAGAAHHVLSNRFYMEMVASFQDGLPRDLLYFVLQCHPDWNTMPPNHRHQRLRLLGIEVIRRGDLALLQLVARVRYRETTGRQVADRRIALPIQHAISNRRPEMLRFIVEKRCDPNARETDMWMTAFALFDGELSILEQLRALGSPSAETCEDDKIQTTLVFALTDIRLLRWVHANVPGMKIPARVMGEAAYANNLEVVEFLHEHYPAQTFRRDMYCRAWAGGAFEVLKYMLQHRVEPYTDRFLERVVDSGSLEVLEVINHYRGLRVLPRFVELANSHRYEAVESFLSAALATSTPLVA